jgi:phospholipid/cholesterol/gamma-HCH transport system substrate-binding protein
MQRSVVETIIGAVVLGVAAFFLYFTYSSGFQRVEGYDVMAKFNRVDGLTLGSDVRLSGITVGKVVKEQIDPASYLAIIHVRIDGKIKLPIDTAAKITSDGLLGSNYIALEPGGDPKMIADGGEITATQDPVNIVDLVGRFIFGGTGNAKSSGNQSNGQSGANRSNSNQSGGSTGTQSTTNPPSNTQQQTTP